MSPDPLRRCLTAGLVAAGLHLAFRRGRRDACACRAPRARRRAQWIMVALALAVLGLAAYQWIASSGEARATGSADRAAVVAVVQIDVQGITCATAIAEELARLAGVAEARVDADRHVATVHYDPTLTSPVALAHAMTSLG